MNPTTPVTPPAPEPLDDTERELARLLRELPAPPPPAALDARILAAARQAVQPKPQRRPIGWWRSIGFGAAASALLGIGLLVQMQRHRPEASTPLPATTPATEAHPAAAVPVPEAGAQSATAGADQVREVRTPSLPQTAPATPASMSNGSAQAAESVGAAAAPEKAVARPNAYAPTAAVEAMQAKPTAPPPPAPPAPVAQAFPATSGEARANTAATAERQAAPAAEPARALPAAPPTAAPAPAVNTVGNLMQEPNVPANLPAMRDEQGPALDKASQSHPEAATGAGVEVSGSRIKRKASDADDLRGIPVSTDAQLPPAQWLERIRARLHAGDHDGARASLRAFQARHPDVAIPDDLRL